MNKINSNQVAVQKKDNEAKSLAKQEWNKLMGGQTHKISIDPVKIEKQQPVTPQQLLNAENRDQEKALVKRYQNEQLSNKVLKSATQYLGTALTVLGWGKKSKS